jgi:uncharacterized protein with PIN domain
MGYDTEYWREGSDDALIAYAAAQGRLIVTRDRGLAGRRKVEALYVGSETLDEQITEVRAALPEPDEPFSRCAACNGLLAELPHDEARDLVPSYVWHTQPTFRRCTGCGRVTGKARTGPPCRRASRERVKGEGR